MTQKERMLKGLLYYPEDAELTRDRRTCQALSYEFNNCHPDKADERIAILKKLIGKTGENLFMEGPIHFDYGYNIELGEGFYANANCIILDVAPVKIGKNVFFGPNVALYTAGHPLHPDTRYLGWEYGIEITIGDNVWIGGSACVTPGVHIGNNVVIGAGSVVTKDIPDNCIAVGNPAKVLRAINDDDKKFYFKDRVFETGGEIQK